MGTPCRAKNLSRKESLLAQDETKLQALKQIGSKIGKQFASKGRNLDWLQ
jgi:hypothetical protein